MRLAGIDLGTNSALLLVAQAKGESVIPLLEEERETRIGEGLTQKRRLTAGAMERTLGVLSQFKGKARRLGSERFCLAGTSALRDAQNREEFLKLLKERLDMELSILSPQEEAELSFRGGVCGLEGCGSQVLLADIGGGSTEIVQGENGEVGKWKSLPLGAVRLTEEFVHSDPISQRDLEGLNEEILRRLQGVSSDFSAKGVLVGVGGTITTLAAMDMGMGDYDPGPIHGYRLSFSSVSSIFDRLRASTLSQRKRMAGLAPKRAEIISAGMAICLHLMRAVFRGEMLVSSRGLRWGLVLRELENL